MSRKAAPKPEELIQKLEEKVDKFKVIEAAAHPFIVYCSPGGSDGQIGRAGGRGGQAPGKSFRRWTARMGKGGEALPNVLHTFQRLSSEQL